MIDYKFGGYFMTFSSARKLAATLKIPIGEETAFQNSALVWHFNDYLHDNNLLHIKAGGVGLPPGSDNQGLVFISQWHHYDGKDETVTEDAKDLEVKKWLEDQGVETKELQWVYMLDHTGIASFGGTKPPATHVTFRENVPLDEMLAKADRAWSRRNMTENTSA